MPTKRSPGLGSANEMAAAISGIALSAIGGESTRVVDSYRLGIRKATAVLSSKAHMPK